MESYGGASRHQRSAGGAAVTENISERLRVFLTDFTSDATGVMNSPTGSENYRPEVVRLGASLRFDVTSKSAEDGGRRD